MVLLWLLALALASAVLSILLWAKGRRDFWKNNGVPYVESPLLLGNIFKAFFLQEQVTKAFDRLYRDKKTHGPFVGFHIFHKPALLIRDPELIKRVLVRDFNYFSNRLPTSDPHSDSIGYFNLLAVKNPHWKSMRNKLTPTFTSGKMKQMFYMVEKVADDLNRYLKEHYSSNQEIEIKEVCSLYTTDVIASIAFGLEVNSLKNPNAEFRQYGKKVFHFNNRRALELNSFFFTPEFNKYLGFKTFSSEVTVFLRNALTEVLEQREKSGTRRNDLVDTLIDLKNADKGKSHTAEEVVFEGDFLLAQTLIFFTAGFETSSTTMSFALYELCKHPKAQEKLRKEIREALHNNGGRFDYDCLTNKMPYLNQVISETLRMYPILAFLERECTPPADEKGYSLEPFDNFVVPPNTPVIVPILSLHMDPKYWENPAEFVPERFGEDGQSITPYTYMPFGTGPHNCIGERFGLMQVRVGLTSILRSFKVEASQKTLEKMEFFPKAVLLQPIDGMNHLRLVSDELYP